MKKFFCTALFMGLVSAGFAQMKSPEAAVIDAHNFFVDQIKAGLTGDKWADPLFADAANDPQFLLKSAPATLEAFKVKADKAGARKVFLTLRGKGSETAYETPKPKKLADKGDAKKAYYTTTDELYTVALDGKAQSEAEYGVTLEWEVTLTDGQVKKEEHVRLVSIKGSENAYTRVQRAAMDEAVKNAIEEWYAGLPKTLDKPYVDEAQGLQEQVVRPSDIKGTMDDRTFTSTGVPTIAVVAPFNVPAGDEAYYDPNPTTSYTLAPKFTVVVNDDLKTATITKVEYTKSNITTPTRKEKAAGGKNTVTLRVEARKAAQEYTVKLPKYVKKPTKEGKAELEGMFVNAKKSVAEVSNVVKGKETIKKNSAATYLARVKAGSEMIIELGEPTEKNDMETVEYPFSQEFSGAGYSDHTEKVIVLKYVDGHYMIEKVTVVKGSTR